MKLKQYIAISFKHANLIMMCNPIYGMTVKYTKENGETYIASGAYLLFEGGIPLRRVGPKRNRGEIVRD